MQDLIFQLQILFISINNFIHQSVGNNEFASGLILAGFFGSIVYVAKSAPVNILNFIKKHSTTSITFKNSERSFHLLSKHLVDLGITKNSRALKVSDGLWGTGQAVKEVGYGSQLFFYNWYTPLIVTVHKEESNSERIKETLSIIKIGRSHKFFDEILEKIQRTEDDDKNTSFYESDGKSEKFITTQPTMDIEKLILPEKIKRELLINIDNFVKKEQWYIDNQIPYQLGILLYGPPGTGKTTIIKCLAGYLKRPVVLTNGVCSLEFSCKTSKNSIIVAEEIDTFGIDKRELESNSDVEKSKNNLTDDFIKEFRGAALGSLLTAIDGVIGNHGRILIMTTNDINKIDPALMRPGRVDLKICVDYLNEETFNSMMKKFFNNHSEVKGKVKPKTSPADLQNDILLGLSRGDLIKKYIQFDL